MPRQTRIVDMESNKGRVIYRKLAADSGPAINIGSRANVNRIKTKIMLKAIIRYLNFKGNTPIIIHRYILNHRIKPGLRQRGFPVQESE